MIPKISLKGDEIKGKAYSLAGRKNFIYRGADTGFFNKWCGIWAGVWKIYEYFAYQINGEWLSPQKMDRFTYLPYVAIHHFKEINNINAKEILFIPLNKNSVISVLRLENKSNEEKEVEILLESAIDIRRKNEDFNLRTYKASFDGARNMVKVKCENETFASFGCDFTQEIDVDVKKRDEYKEHYPGGELQRCYIPFNYKVSFIMDPGETFYLPFVYAFGKNDEEVRNEYDSSLALWKEELKRKVSHKLELLHQELRCKNKKLSRFFSFSINALDEFLIDVVSGKEAPIAGYPWFLEIWGRDALWSLLGYMDAGMFKETESTLEVLASGKQNRIPCFIAKEINNYTLTYHAADTNPFFVLIANMFKKKTGKKNPVIEWAINSIFSKAVFENFLAVHKPEETWMDSIKRQGTAVEIQGIWSLAFEHANLRKEKIYGNRVKRVFKSAFWNTYLDYPFDTFDIKNPRGAITPNCFIPMLFGAYSKIEEKKILKTAEEHLLNDIGVATLSRKDKNYSPSSYHCGATWGFTTMLGICCFLRGNSFQKKKAIEMLENLADRIEEFHLGFVSEVWDSKTKKSIGASGQLWSVSFFPYIIDSLILGLRWDCEKNMLSVEPDLKALDVLGDLCRKGKILGFGDLVIDIEISKISNGYELIFSPKIMRGKKYFTCKLKIKNAKTFFVNGKVRKGKEKDCLNFRISSRTIVRAVTK